MAIKKNRGTDIDLDAIPIDAPKTYGLSVYQDQIMRHISRQTSQEEFNDQILDKICQV